MSCSLLGCRVFCSLVGLEIVSLALGAPLYKGMSYTAWSQSAYSGVPSDQSLASMKLAGVDTVSINVWEFQSNVNSSAIAPRYDLYSASPESVRHAIQTAKGLGMKVMLKPNVDLSADGSHWRGDINPSTAWFAGYQSFINRWADVAQQEGADIFSLGCELVNTQGWSSNWSSVATNVRSQYSGRLTYSANAYSEQGINWWNSVDVIGIDAYYQLTNSTNASLSDLKAAWVARANDIGAWRNTSWSNMPVMFTEVGYRSTNGANTQPWAWGSDYGLNLQEQSNCYEALLSTMWDKSWWQGAFWWNWETDPNAGGMNDQGYTPQGKPALDILKRYYSPVPEPSPLLVLGLSILLLWRKRRNLA